MRPSPWPNRARSCARSRKRKRRPPPPRPAPRPSSRAPRTAYRGPNAPVGARTRPSPPPLPRPPSGAETGTAMLVTHVKKRLPRGWSYPIGAQDVSRYLEGIPGATDKPLSFRDRAGWFHSQLDALRGEDHPYPILRLSLQRGGYSVRDQTAVHWEVYIYAVPSGLRAAVRKSLLPAGMRRVRAWLMASRPDTALDGGACCTVLVRESDTLLYFERSASRFEDPVREEIEA